MKTVLALILGASGALAQTQTVWGQCGGIGWSGSTSCEAGTSCVVVNDWYYQCQPGSSPNTPTTTTTTTGSTPTSTFTPINTGFAFSSGTMFSIDGSVSYWPGTNCYPCTENLGQSAMETALQHMAQDGLKIIRVWGFNDVNSDPGSGSVWFHLVSSSGSRINTGSNGLQRLDNVVAAAEANGLKLIINFVNNWDDYGGINAYVNAFGGSHTSWYTNSAAQAEYRNYIDAVVSRYRESSAVFAWELANEPRCNGCDTSVIYEWASSTSAYVKSLDSNHMVTLGDEGFGLAGGSSYPYQYSEGLDFAMNLGISTIDFGTFHFYPEYWGLSDSDGQNWIQSHAQACVAAGKPCFFEEYGTAGDECTVMGGWQQTCVNTNGMAGDAFWQYGDDSSWHDDGHTIFRGTTAYQCLVLNRPL